MERPNVYVDPSTGTAQAFLLSCVPTEDTQSNPREGACVIIWPVDNWKPGDSTAMPQVGARARDVTVLPLGDSITENDHFRYAVPPKNSVRVGL